MVDLDRGINSGANGGSERDGGRVKRERLRRKWEGGGSI
jgi:hypothetical protein